MHSPGSALRCCALPGLSCFSGASVKRGMVLRAMRTGPLDGIAAIPGDKSCSHRALILGALAEGETRIAGLLESKDVAATMQAIEAFGARVERGADECLVTGSEWRSPGGPVD